MEMISYLVKLKQKYIRNPLKEGTTLHTECIHEAPNEATNRGDVKVHHKGVQTTASISLKSRNDKFPSLREFLLGPRKL